MLEKLKELALRYEDLQAQLADPSVYGDAERLKTVNRELKDLTPVAEAYQAYRQAEADRAAAEELLSDPEMRELAQEELTAAREEMERLRQELGREPVLSELSEASGLTPEEIAQVGDRHGHAGVPPAGDRRRPHPGGDAGHGRPGGGHGGADRPAGVHRSAAGEGADDHSSPLLQGTDPGTDCPDPGGVSGAGIPVGAPGPETAAGVPLALKCASPWNSVMVPQYRLGMWVMRHLGL